MFTCAYCGDTDSAVTMAAQCNDKCDIFAHGKCWEARKATMAWKKKHASKSNGCREICPVVGCYAKLRPKGVKFDGCEILQESKTCSARDDEIESGVAATCCMFTASGLPCHRAAMEHGMCAVHAKKAMREKRAKPSEIESAGKEPIMCNASTETELTIEMLDNLQTYVDEFQNRFGDMLLLTTNLRQELKISQDEQKYATMAFQMCNAERMKIQRFMQDQFMYGKMHAM